MPEKKHLQDWVYVPSQDSRVPMVKIPHGGIGRDPGFLLINQPQGSIRGVWDDIARLVAAAPALYALAEQLEARGMADRPTMKKCAEAIAIVRGTS